MTNTQLQAVAFGEVLFDCFEDQACIGGAPLNFAWYMRQFAVPVAMVSAVGRDPLGAAVRRSLQEAGIEQSWVFERPEPTGTVDVQLADGQPEYTINENVAWDCIELSGKLQMQPDLLYFGTLAQRTEVNRAALKKLLALESRHRFFDINLRQNYYSVEIVLDGLQKATILKLNEEEWSIIRGLIREESPARMLERFDLETIALTRGGEGAELYVPGKKLEATSARVAVVDAVGAGDAFSAALAAGAMRNADLEQTLQVACEAGAFVVQQRGAQVELPETLRGAFRPQCGQDAF